MMNRSRASQKRLLIVGSMMAALLTAGCHGAGGATMQAQTVELKDRAPDSVCIDIPNGWYMKESDAPGDHSTYWQIEQKQDDADAHAQSEDSQSSGERAYYQGSGIEISVIPVHSMVSSGRFGDLEDKALDFQAEKDAKAEDLKAAEFTRDFSTAEDRQIGDAPAYGFVYTQDGRAGIRPALTYEALREDGVWTVFVFGEVGSDDVPQELIESIDTLTWVPTGTDCK